MTQTHIAVRGAREHNSNIAEIPRETLVRHHGTVGLRQVLAGLRHDLCRGQRRYVESLSAYARQFLELMQKPDVDLIEGLSPHLHRAEDDKP